MLLFTLSTINNPTENIVIFFDQSTEFVLADYSQLKDYFAEIIPFKQVNCSTKKEHKFCKRLSIVTLPHLVYSHKNHSFSQLKENLSFNSMHDFVVSKLPQFDTISDIGLLKHIMELEDQYSPNVCYYLQKSGSPLPQLLWHAAKQVRDSTRIMVMHFNYEVYEQTSFAKLVRDELNQLICQVSGEFTQITDIDTFKEWNIRATEIASSDKKEL